MATAQQNVSALLNAITDPVTLSVARKGEIVQAYVDQANDMNILRAVNDAPLLPPGTVLDVPALLALPKEKQVLPAGVSVDRPSLTDEQKCKVMMWRKGWEVLTVMRQQRREADEAAAEAAIAAGQAGVTL